MAETWRRYRAMLEDYVLFDRIDRDALSSLMTELDVDENQMRAHRRAVEVFAERMGWQARLRPLVAEYHQLEQKLSGRGVFPAAVEAHSAGLTEKQTKPEMIVRFRQIEATPSQLRDTQGDLVALRTAFPGLFSEAATNDPDPAKLTKAIREFLDDTGISGGKRPGSQRMVAGRWKRHD